MPLFRTREERDAADATAEAVERERERRDKEQAVSKYKRARIAVLKAIKAQGFYWPSD